MKPARSGQDHSAAEEDQAFHLHPVHLDGFDGPLDLLLFLVRENKVDVSEVSLAVIADQYLEFVYLMPLLTPTELEDAADFLGVAAVLAWLKSKSLLPVHEQEEAEEEEEADAAELLLRLKEYERFAAPADWLWSRYRQFSLMFPRGLSQLQTPELDLGEISLFDLAAAFRELLEKAAPEPVTKISPFRIDIQQSMKDLLLRLRTRARPLTLVELVGDNPTRITVLSCFLALLELIKAKKVRASQASPYGAITVALADGAKPKGRGSRSGEGERLC